MPGQGICKTNLRKIVCGNEHYSDITSSVRMS